MCIRDRLTQGHSSGAVTADPGKFGGVARPVPTGVSGPAGSGSDAEMEEVGEDRGGNFGGELEQGGPPPDYARPTGRTAAHPRRPRLARAAGHPAPARRRSSRRGPRRPPPSQRRNRYPLDPRRRWGLVALRRRTCPDRRSRHLTSAPASTPRPTGTRRSWNTAGYQYASRSGDGEREGAAGHASITTTVDTYGHLTIEDARATLEAAGWFTRSEVRL